MKLFLLYNAIMWLIIAIFLCFPYSTALFWPIIVGHLDKKCQSWLFCPGPDLMQCNTLTKYTGRTDYISSRRVQDIGTENQENTMVKKGSIETRRMYNQKRLNRSERKWLDFLFFFSFMKTIHLSSRAFLFKNLPWKKIKSAKENRSGSSTWYYALYV